MPDRGKQQQEQIDEILGPFRWHLEYFPPIYSAWSNVAVALFGGIYGILSYTALTSGRLGRFTRDLPPLIIVGILWSAVLLWGSHTPFRDLMPSSTGSGGWSLNAIRFSNPFFPIPFT